MLRDEVCVAGTRCRSTEATAARVHGQIQTLRRPTDFGASAKRSRRRKIAHAS